MILTKILPGLLGIFACVSISMAAEQGVTLSKANEVAVERYAKKYIANPEGRHILKGILWVESKYGKYKSGKGSYGIAQIEIPTARYVAEKFGFKIPKSDRGVKEMLMRDDKMSIRLAAAYLGMLEKRFGTLDHVIVAYNLGPTKLSGIAKNGRRVTTEYLAKVTHITGENKRSAKAASSRARLAETARKPSGRAPLPEHHLAKRFADTAVSVTAETTEPFYGQEYCADSVPGGGVTEARSYLYDMTAENAHLEPLSCDLAGARAGVIGGAGLRASG